MEDYNTIVDMPSPYMYEDTEHYLDTNASESQSSVNSPYDMSSLADFGGFSGVYPSPESEEEESSQTTTQQKPAAKRKRENRYKNAPPSVLSRRRAQNRASQRAYRERKDQRIKDLEQMLNDAKQRNDVLGQAYSSLHAEYLLLRSQQQKDHHHPTSSYTPSDPYLIGGGGGYSYNASTSGSSSSSLVGGHDPLDLDMYVYQDMSSGAGVGY